MRTLYIAYTEEVGEAEAMFDADGTILGMWACNDATWRNEYFSGFMEALGYKVETAPQWMVDNLTAECREAWGV